ncbi:MAG: hypothetical protein EBQ99_04095 [Planctomycetes bacterium]|nr:hypothetical protein [Planctomycetota bacterium]
MQAIQQQVDAVLASGRVGVPSPIPAGNAGPMQVGWPALQGADLPWHGVHEAFGALDAAALRLPAMSMALHLAWRAVMQAPSPHRVLWVGRHAWPHPRALLGSLRGLRGGWRQRLDARLWHASVFVDAGGLVDRLWATEMSLQAPGAVLVVADGAGLNLTATRRLQLAATACPVLLLRPAHEAASPSAAIIRWRVQAGTHQDQPAWTARAVRVRSGLPPAWLDAAVSWDAWWERGSDAVAWEGILPRVNTMDRPQHPMESEHGTHAGDPAAVVARRPGDPIAPPAGGLAA